MIINSVNINNFRSIKELTLPFTTYKNNGKRSSTIFLVGINESGKSSILDALSLISGGMNSLDYEMNCFLEAQDDEYSYIDLYLDINIDWERNSSFWKKQILENTEFDDDFIKNLIIQKLQKNIYRDKESAHEHYLVTINETLPFHEYVVTTISKPASNGKIQNTEIIEKLAIANEVNEKITPANAPSFLKDNQELVTKDKVQSKIASALKRTFDYNLPKILVWKSKPEYLINETIDLTEFKNNPNMSIPLKNIFSIFGKTTDDAIAACVDKALTNQARCDELQEKLSETVTKYINKIWKEHKIKIRISINGNNCKVHVEDNDKKFAYYTMNQRSDGFKQFLSLILSLSVQNETKSLKNNIILIDEPEVHLHPSGIRYLRDEILKIGENNIVVVSTHSHYMIDTDTPQRHWVVQKDKSETKITQLSETTHFFDDKVIATAFGLNLIKELLPKHIIVVEGIDDKNIISHSINFTNPEFTFSLKAAGGASKVPGYARLFNDEQIQPFIIFDADNEGATNKKSILDHQKNWYSTKNVFTLKDILNTLPTNSTIEDLLPLQFVKDFFEEELKTELTLTNDQAILTQLKPFFSKNNIDKQRIESLKIKLSTRFISEFDTVAKVRKATSLHDFITKLVEKIKLFKSEN